MIKYRLIGLFNIQKTTNRKQQLCMIDIILRIMLA